MRMRFALLVTLLASSPEDTVAPGKAIFLERCSMCHGENGDGQGALAADLPLHPRNFRGERLQWGNSRRSVEETVMRGRSDVMPAFEEVLTPDEITKVADYVWSIIPPALQSQPFDPAHTNKATHRVFLVRQRGKKFVPATLTARVGDTVIFVNDDTFDHDVHETGVQKAPSIRSQKPKQWDRLVLSRTGSLDFGCAIHPSMRLHVEVAP